MADSIQSTPHRPTLVYGYPEGEGLVFAPLDEVKLYAAMRRGEGFPMTWGQFRTSFGEEAYQVCVEWCVENARWKSFEEYLAEGEDDGFGYDTGEPILGWSEWTEDYEQRFPDSWPGNCFQFCLDVVTSPESHVDEVRDWWRWCIDRRIVEMQPLDQFEGTLRRWAKDGLALARKAYRGLPTGDEAEGRVPQDDDEAIFSDGDCGRYQSPKSINYWPAQRMLEWFPEQLARDYGRVRQSVVDGEFLELYGRCEEIVAALEALGYACVEDDKLMDVSSGY